MGSPCFHGHSRRLQVVIAPIPGELTGVVGGFLFGTWRAVVYSSLGLTVGSAVAFMLARLIGLPFVKLFVPAGPVREA